jgi:outer membrane protein assembly factor BamA
VPRPPRPALVAWSALAVALAAPAAATAGPGPVPGARPAEVEPGDAFPRPSPEAAPLVQRSVTIVEIEVRGREQVSRRQIEEILESEGLAAGTVVLWPEDPRVEEARAALVATGYFARVTLRLVPRRGSLDRADLVVELRERGSLELSRIFLGSSRLTPFHGGLELVERNFLGRSVHVGGGLMWGTLPREIPRAQRQQGYRLFGEAPRIASTPVGIYATAQFLSASEPYRVAGAADDPAPELFRTVDYTRIGGELGVDFSITAEWRFGVGYRFERVDAAVPDEAVWVTEKGESRVLDLGLRNGRHRLTSLDFSLSWDGREPYASLGRGGRFGLDVQLAALPLGSQYEYVKVVLGAAYGFRLPWDHSITPVLLAGEVAGIAPRFERFFPGDLSAWTPGRELGLVYSTRNPIDLLGTGLDRQGLGSYFARIDLEYAIPLFRRPRTKLIDGGHLFFGVGSYVISGDAAERSQRRHDGLPAVPVGVDGNMGLRLDTGLGRVDLSVGNVLRRVPL